MHPGNQQQGVFLSSSFPHDSAPRSLAEQSQYHTSESPSPQSQTSQSHYSQSSEIPLSQLQQYDTKSHEFKSEGLQSLEPQIKWLQLQPSQIEFAQFSQSHLSQMQPSQLQSSHFHPSQLQPPRLQPSHLQSSQSQPSHLQTPQLSQAPQLQIPRLQTPQLQIPRLQTPQLQTPQLQTPRLQTPRLQIPRLQTPRLQTPLLQTPLLQTPRSQTPQLQTLQLQTPLLQTPQLQTPQLQSLRLQTPRLQPPLLQTLQSQTPQSQTTQSPTTQSQTTQSPTTQSQTTQSLITQSQTTQSQTTQSQTTQSQTTQSQTTQSQTTQSQTTQSQTTQSQTTQSQTTQSQATQSQTTQSQTPQLPPIPPPFWQHPDGSCWWGYYPVHYPPSLNATTPPSSSLSSPSTRAKYNPPIPQHISPAPYENDAYYTGCHHHHHHQDGNAFAYYHPFYDERLYAAVTTAAIRTTNANGIPSSDAGASQLCTDLSSSSSSSCCSSSSCSSSSLNEGTLADVSNVLVTEDRASSCQPLASTPSTIHHRASASRPVPVFIHEPAKKLPGYDSNCNPCLERAEGSCTAETSIFRCPPVLVRNPASTQQGFPVFRGVNAWTRDRDDSISKDPALTEPGPPPWIQNIQDSLSVDDNGTEIVGTVEQSGSSIDQCNEVGWNLDGTIGAQDKSITRQFDKHLNGMKLKGTEMNAARRHQSDNYSEMEKQRCNPNSDEANRVDKKIEDEKPKWNRKNVEPNRIDKKFDDEKPQWIGSDVESFKVENPRWNGSSVAPSRDDRDSDVAEQRWNRIDNASRNLNEIAPSIPMNILHDERNVNESPVVDEVKNNDGRSFDRSEDTNASDSEIDTSSNDSSVDPERVCDDRATNTEDESDSESDSDDSDSYLAYSTGLNPHDKLVRRSNDGDAVKICADRESKKSETSITSSEDDFEERSLVVSADRSNATDCESCVEEDDEIMEVAKIEVDKDTNLDNLKVDDIAPHRLSVIPEDGEQNDRRSATPNATGSDGCRNVAADRNADLTTVSISLPLRFRFSVRENEGDVTTVIVGNSTVRTETLVKGEDTDEVCVNLKLADDADTRADFTLRRNVSGEVETREPNECEENDEIDFWGTENKTSNGTISDGKEEKSRNEGADESNGDLISRSDSKTLVAQDDCIDFWETITSGRVSPDLSYNSKRDGDRIYRFSWRETDSKEDEEKEEVEEDEKKNSIDEENVKGELSPTLKIDDSRRCEEEEEEEEEADKDEEEESEAEEEPEEETLETSRENEDEASQKNDSTPQFELTEAKTDETEESNGRSNLENSKHLLSVQNSRDETDDEDSGVTSDMSRLISEVDTDSECGPTRKMNSYKRTQTHSRLFRLLSREDDPQGSEETPKNDSAGRDRLSLPLNSSGFSYDESHHCSNYSSGLTSPDYSPVYEGAWRRLHGDDNGTSEKPNSPGGVDNNYDEPSKNRRDPYFENWKKAVTENKIQEEKITSYNALKIVNCGKGGVLPNWRFRTNVLCPRIKSTKNVPRTIRNNRSAKPVISSSSTSNSVGKSKDNAFLTKYS